MDSQRQFSNEQTRKRKINKEVLSADPTTTTKTRATPSYNADTTTNKSEDAATVIPTVQHKKQKINQSNNAGGFQLPNDILKNLTPVTKSPPRDKSGPSIRRQELLQSIRFRLSEKSSRISRKLDELHKQRQMRHEERTRKLSDELHQASMRRNEYLSLVKQRATRFYRDMDETITPTVSVEKKRQVPRKKNISRTSLTADNNITLWIISVQRLATRCLFHKYINQIKESQFLDKYQFMSFNQVLSITRDSQIKSAISFVLKYLKVPHISGVEYRAFFYCFIMMADFNDCMDARTKSLSHPGFNTNTSTQEEREQFYNNCIWVMLYKCGLYLIHEFNKVVEHGSLTDKFRKYWDDYHYTFRIFKWNHYRSLKELLFESISVVDRQIKALSYLHEDTIVGDLHDQKQKLQDEMILLNSYQMDELMEFNDSSSVEMFTSQFRDYVYQTYQPSRSSVFIQNAPNIICFYRWRFRIPMVFPVDEWRKYCFDHFYKMEVERNTSDFPKELRTGFTSSDKKRNLLDISQLIDANSVTAKTVLDNLIEYYMEFTNSQEIAQMAHLDFDRSETFHLQNIKHILKCCPLKSNSTNTTALRLVTSCIADAHTSFYNDSLMELHNYVCNLFIEKCLYKTSHDYRMFENLYVLLNECSNFSKLKFGVFTISPMLVFPEFYQKVIVPHTELNMDGFRNVISSSCIGSFIDGDVAVECHEFFYGLFVDEIVTGHIPRHEINGLLREKFREFHETLEVVIDVNVRELMRECYNGENFEEYYENNKNRIKEVLVDKMKGFLIGRYDQISRVFRYRCEEVTKLVDEIKQYVNFICKLYVPILNWIYSSI